MNLFLEDKLEITSTDPINSISYSNKKDEPILAVIRDKEIEFYGDDNRKLQYGYKNTDNITCYKWHPALNKIAVGNAKGEIDVFDASFGNLKSEKQAHSADIDTIDFSKNGELMVTSDKNFTMGFWVDIIPIKVEQKNAPINRVLFLDFMHEKKDNSKKNIRLVFVGDKMGNIEYFEEKRLTLQELCSLNGSIKELFYYKKNKTIIVITSTYYFIQFKISTEEDIIPDKKVKLSIVSSSDNLKGLWIAPNTFMLNSKENIIRFWNIEKDKNYAINLFDYISESKNERRLSVLEVEYDKSNGVLYAYLSNGEIIVMKANNNGMIEDESDWKKISVISTSNLPGGLKCLRAANSTVGILADNKITVYKRAKIKLFIEQSKNFKMLQKSLNKIEFFNNLTSEPNNFTLNEKIDDFLVKDDIITFITITKEIFSLNLLEVITNAQKRDIKGENVRPTAKGYKKLQSVYADPRIKKIVLTKYGYCGIESSQKLHFMNYNNNKIIEFRTTKENEYFVDIITNSSFDKIALVDNKFNVKVFETGKSSLKIIYENINLSNIVDEVKNVKKDELNDIEKDLENLLGLIDIKTGEAENENTNKKRTKVEKVILNDKADKMILITSASYNNIILVNMKKSKTYASSYEQDPTFVIEDCIFDNSDDRFAVIKGHNSSNEHLVLTIVIEEENFKILNSLQVPENAYLLNSSFPEIYISTLDSKNEIKIDRVYHEMFKNTTFQDEFPAALKEILRDFCYYISVENLQQSVVRLKKLEKNFELDEFWKNLLELALKSRNLKIAELALSKMKFVRASRFMEQVGQGSSLPQSDNDRLGSLALLFNQLDVAKRIFFENKNYEKVCEVLFTEGKYETLLQFCHKYDKTLLNLYTFKIAEKHLEFGDFKRFIELSRKSGARDEYIARKLSQCNRIDLLEQQLNTNRTEAFVNTLYKYNLQRGDADKAKEILTFAHPGNHYLIDHRLHVEKNFEAAKMLAQATPSPNNKGLLELAKEIESKGDHLSAVDLLLKGKFYTKVIQLIRNNYDDISKNEDTFSKINDLIYDCLMHSDKDFRSRYVADYFLALGYKEKAIKLYIRSGDLRKAHQLTEEHKHDYLLPQIEQAYNAKQINIKSKQDLRSKYSFGSGTGFAVNSKEAEVEMAIAGRNYEKVYEIVKEGPVSLRSEYLDLIKNSDFDKKKDLLYIIASRWKNSGKYDKAIDLYVDLKDNLKALKTMIKAKKVAQIIQFANFARQDNIYELAANFLQTTKVSFDDNTFKCICSFYSKSRSIVKLIDFLLSYSVVEFENSNYGNCADLLDRAKKLLPKVDQTSQMNYSARLKIDNEMIEDMLNVTSLQQARQFEDQARGLKAIIENHGKSKFYKDYELKVLLLKCYIDGNDKEGVKLVIKDLSAYSSKNYLKYLNMKERDGLLRVCPSLSEEDHDETPVDEIDELLN